MTDKKKKFRISELGRGRKIGGHVEYNKTINPDLAERMLATSPYNRTRTTRGSTYIEEEMQNGKWKDVGDPLRFDKLGRLVDGHGRLDAIIITESTLPFTIRTGLTREEVRIVDRGDPRTMQNILQMEGAKNVGRLGSVMTQLLCWENGDKIASSPAKFSSAAVVGAYKEHGEALAYSMEFGKAGSALFSPGVVSFLHFHCTRLTSKAVADEFFTKLCYGTELNKNHPAFILRKQMLTLLEKKQKTGATMQPYRKKVMIIKAWNAWRCGEEVKHIAPPTALSNTEYPEISQ